MTSFGKEQPEKEANWVGLGDDSNSQNSTQISIINQAATRGFSAKYGAYLEKIRTTEMGRLILSEVVRRPMEATV
jgi:hypothetical protein